MYLFFLRKQRFKKLLHLCRSGEKRDKNKLSWKTEERTSVNTDVPLPVCVEVVVVVGSQWEPQISKSGLSKQMLTEWPDWRKNTEQLMELLEAAACGHHSTPAGVTLLVFGGPSGIEVDASSISSC